MNLKPTSTYFEKNSKEARAKGGEKIWELRVGVRNKFGQHKQIQINNL